MYAGINKQHSGVVRSLLARQHGPRHVEVEICATLTNHVAEYTARIITLICNQIKVLKCEVVVG